MNTWGEITDKCIHMFTCGDLQAFEQIQNVLQSQVRGFVINRCNDRELAADVAQDTWLKVWQNRQSVEFRSTTEFRSWVFRIAKNQLVDRFRRMSKRNEDDVTTAADNLAIREARDAAVTEDETLKLEVLRACLEIIGSDKAELIRMYCEGLSAEQISEILGVTQQIVYQRKNRAMSILGQCVKGKLS